MTNPINIDNQDYLAPTWSEMGELTASLARKIKSGGKKYDRLIALAKGGLGWARQLQDILEIPELSSIQITFYKGIDQTNKTPVVIQSLPISCAGESILVYDDVVDRGDTLKLAKDYLKMHGASEVHSASHFEKPWTTEHPDFYAGSTDAWIIFPHDSTEMIKLLKAKWTGIKTEELVRRLTKIGLEKSIINLALNQE